MILKKVEAVDNKTQQTVVVDKAHCVVCDGDSFYFFLAGAQQHLQCNNPFCKESYTIEATGVMNVA